MWPHPIHGKSDGLSTGSMTGAVGGMIGGRTETSTAGGASLSGSEELGPGGVIAGAETSTAGGASLSSPEDGSPGPSIEGLLSVGVPPVPFVGEPPLPDPLATFTVTVPSSNLLL